MCRYLFRLDISGLVQGVGFRPFVYKLAIEKRLFGEVYNDTKGVVVVLCCDKEKLKDFVKSLKSRLKADAPLANIDKITISKQKFTPYSDFTIAKSKINTKKSPILSDFALCESCKKEFYDPKNSRFHYPFITCTHCGVRFSIIKKLPYDRKNTTMSDFKMCERCHSEFCDPQNRRFHAQPISCPKCEIRVSLLNADKKALCEGENAFKQAAAALKAGKIIAMKGVGGFHLVCDALNEKAIMTLRVQKNRPKKPLAVLCKDLEMAKTLAYISKKEASLLNSMIAPIVILRAKKQSVIAPNIDKIGIMLACSPFQLLFFEHFDNPIIATSANISGESIIYDENTLFSRLGGVFDLVLCYDRDIYSPSDDSIAQVIGREVMFLRTSRGVRPEFIALDENFKHENALALGAELKNTFAISHKSTLLLSPYIGDMKSIDVLGRFRTLLDFFKATYECDFTHIIADKHPHFRYSKDFAPTQSVQHHYAHACATLFEHRIFSPALAFAFDGTGYGDDGAIWGGEIFLASLAKYERVGHFEQFTLINADIKNITNIALSLIWQWDLQGVALNFLANFSETQLKNLKKIHAQSTLKCTSLGRIIDAFGAVIFGKKMLDYEGQIGLLMETFYDEKLAYSYDFKVRKGVICVKDAFKQAFLDDERHACTGFLNALADLIIDFSAIFRARLAKKPDILEKFGGESVNFLGEDADFWDENSAFKAKKFTKNGKNFDIDFTKNTKKDDIEATKNTQKFDIKNLAIVLCGGVFQNATLLKILQKRHFKYKTSLKYPPNDSSIALGQMAHFLYKGCFKD